MFHTDAYIKLQHIFLLSMSKISNGKKQNRSHHRHRHRQSKMTEEANRKFPKIHIEIYRIRKHEVMMRSHEIIRFVIQSYNFKCLKLLPKRKQTQKWKITNKSKNNLHRVKNSMLIGNRLRYIIFCKNKRQLIFFKNKNIYNLLLSIAIFTE